MMLIDAGNFFCAGLLRNAVQNIECGLYRPTDKKRRGDVIFRPLQHLLDLRPVGNIVKFNQSQRGAGDDQAVKVLVANIVEVTVEVIQVFTWRIAGFTRIDT